MSRSITSLLTFRRSGLIGQSWVCAQMPWSIGVVSHCRNICRNLIVFLHALQPRFQTVSLRLSNLEGGRASPTCSDPAFNPHSTRSFSAQKILALSCTAFHQLVPPHQHLRVTPFLHQSP